jgi:hypothetical protein
VLAKAEKALAIPITLKLELFYPNWSIGPGFGLRSRIYWASGDE